MTANDIYLTLKKLAPNVYFSAGRKLDPSFIWDGDAPDPAEDGFDPYDVTVRAAAIINGELIEDSDSLGGSYFKENEPLDDIHGYLPEMLQEAAALLQDHLILSVSPSPLDADAAQHRSHTIRQLDRVLDFLKQELRARWQTQQDEKKEVTH